MGVSTTVVEIVHLRRPSHCLHAGVMKMDYVVFISPLTFSVLSLFFPARLFSSGSLSAIVIRFVSGWEALKPGPDSRNRMGMT